MENRKIKIIDNPAYTPRKKQINCLSMELETLWRKLLRYQKRLFKDAFIVAKAKGIESEFVDLDNIDSSIFEPEGSETIPIYRKGNNANAEILLKLAKERSPTLYRRFIVGRKIYKEKYSQLEELTKNKSD